MSEQLSRQVGLGGAVVMGLGSILGTGVFVSLGLGAELAGRGLPLALLLAAGLALCNGLSSAQLAAAFPVSGGTYEYAHRTLSPAAGFTAGWMFLIAKSASAATAALGLAAYVQFLTGAAPGTAPMLALGAVLAVTALAWSGLRRSTQVNAVVVAITVLGLLVLVLAGGPSLVGGSPPRPAPILPAIADLPGLLNAVALMFVAYTGYGRIATLGEEVVEPRRTIPRAMVVALAVVCGLYVAIAVTALGVLGASDFAEATRAGAPLRAVARAAGAPWAETSVAVAAVTAMLGVLLNLVLGLSRVLLAMARRGEMPSPLARIEGGSPGPAVLAMGNVVALLVLVGDIRLTWSFSALTVLVYYALANLAALAMPEEQRLYPRWVSGLGLAGCLSLTVWIERELWLVGAILLAVGFALRALLSATSVE